jgi:hypothetical protein
MRDNVQCRAMRIHARREPKKARTRLQADFYHMEGFAAPLKGSDHAERSN